MLPNSTKQVYILIYSDKKLLGGVKISSLYSPAHTGDIGTIKTFLVYVSTSGRSGPPRKSIKLDPYFTELNTTFYEMKLRYSGRGSAYSGYVINTTGDEWENYEFFRYFQLGTTHHNIWL